MSDYFARVIQRGFEQGLRNAYAKVTPDERNFTLAPEPKRKKPKPRKPRPPGPGYFHLTPLGNIASIQEHGLRPHVEHPLPYPAIWLWHWRDLPKDIDPDHTRKMSGLLREGRTGWLACFEVDVTGYHLTEFVNTVVVSRPNGKPIPPKRLTVVAAYH